VAKEYNISRPTGTCAGCDRAFEVGDGFFTILKDTDEELARNDFCLDCWDKNPQQGEGILGVWRGKIPAKQEKKRVFIDDELLVSFFSSLEGTEDPSRISLRFVVALALMRKRLLSYDGVTTTPDGREMWKMSLRKVEKPFMVANPHLDEEKIAEVSQRLGEILNGELA